MKNKTITPKQFFNNWVRTTKNPDGESINTYIAGGKNDSYRKWILQKNNQISALKQNLQKQDKTQQIETKTAGSTSFPLKYPFQPTL